jgi:hypothetical protein
MAFTINASNNVGIYDDYNSPITSTMSDTYLTCNGMLIPGNILNALTATGPGTRFKSGLPGYTTYTVSDITLYNYDWR